MWSLNNAPALFIRTSIVSPFARRRSISSSVSFRRLRSANSNRISVLLVASLMDSAVCAALTSSLTTSVNDAPAEARSMAAASPIPELAPVRTTWRPSMRSLIGAQTFRPVTYPCRVNVRSALKVFVSAFAFRALSMASSAVAVSAVSKPSIAS